MRFRAIGSFFEPVKTQPKLEKRKSKGRLERAGSLHVLLLRGAADTLLRVVVGDRDAGRTELNDQSQTYAAERLDEIVPNQNAKPQSRAPCTKHRIDSRCI
jgi:hypothetical protein